MKAMNISKYIFILLFILFGCSSAIQLPQRQVVQPTENNMYLGSKYKNQQGLLNKQGLPLKPVAYFNYEDFRDFSPSGALLPKSHTKLKKT